MAKIFKVILISLSLGFIPTFASAAILYINPASGTFEIGDRVTARVMVSSGAPINAISGTVSFPTSIFSIESVSKSGSILDFWVNEPNFSQGAGTLQFEGVTLGGFNGGLGTVVTVTLRAVKAGSGSALFKFGQILANDGQGTDVTDGTTGATFSVEPARETPKPTPEPTPRAPEVSQPAPSLNSPEIMLARKYGEQAISGTSNYPNAQVLVTFVSIGGVKIFITGTTDNQGQFTLTVPRTLKHGSYRVYAVVIQPNLANSYTSNEITVSVGNIFSDISWELRWAILLLLITLIYLVVRSYRYLKKNKKLKIFVRKEAKEMEEIVHKSFKVIREDVGKNKKVREDLDDAENLISKEIKDIEKS